PTGTNIILQDSNPEPGINQYRVRLENNSMESVYISNYEKIFYVRNQDLFIYPNPIATGEMLNVVVNDLGTVTLRVFDMMGRMMQEVTDPGTIKTIDTTALIKGAYIVEVLKTDGSRLTTRLMIF
ncbi:MAG TPA: T9SS type A sorting domain-containing protein, partial [Cyclobacteriaceae bacterium]|nr:T9SS type A sorting domain-containing protein [Cyclobacteriaceae bacterium]